MIFACSDSFGRTCSDCFGSVSSGRVPIPLVVAFVSFTQLGSCDICKHKTF